MTEKNLRWKRVLLKLSGEALSGKGEFGIDVNAARYIANEIKTAHDLGCEIAIAIGGGNFIRGKRFAELGIDRPTADNMGMLAHLINALALQSVLESIGLHTRVMSAIDVMQVAEPFIRRRATRHLEKDRIVIFAAGTGSPYFTTDTAAALRALEVSADAILKATNVEGVYDDDPKKNINAKLLKEIDAMDMIQKGIGVMDLTAVTLARENKIPVDVFDVFKEGNLKRILHGEKIGSEVT